MQAFLNGVLDCLLGIVFKLDEELTSVLSFLELDGSRNVLLALVFLSFLLDLDKAVYHVFHVSLHVVVVLGPLSRRCVIVIEEYLLVLELNAVFVAHYVHIVSLARL